MEPTHPRSDASGNDEWRDKQVDAPLPKNGSDFNASGEHNHPTSAEVIMRTAIRPVDIRLPNCNNNYFYHGNV